MKKKVFRLEITMHNVVFIEHLESLEHLGKIGEGRFFRKCSSLFQQLF